MKTYSLDYKQLLGKTKPVVNDFVCNEDGHEVERITLAEMKDGKWVEDYIIVKRIEANTMIDDDGAVFSLTEDGRILVKAPDVEYYRIPETVCGIAEYALKDCKLLKELDVPYNVCETDIENVLKHSPNKIKVRKWNWGYGNQRSEELEKNIAEGWTDEYGFVYSKDRRHLLKAVSVEKYWIPEGVEKINRLAFVGCTFEELNIPCTCNLETLSESEYPVFGSEDIVGCVITWDKPYSQEDEIDNSLCTTTDATFIDEHGVIYSENKKRLLGCLITFDDAEYYVPEGVVTICSLAFAHCKHFITLSVPPSVKIIGSSLFGENGGRIIIRKD